MWNEAIGWRTPWQVARVSCDRQSATLLHRMRRTAGILLKAIVDATHSLHPEEGCREEGGCGVNRVDHLHACCGAGFRRGGRRRTGTLSPHDGRLVSRSVRWADGPAGRRLAGDLAW